MAPSRIRSLTMLKVVAARVKKGCKTRKRLHRQGSARLSLSQSAVLLLVSTRRVRCERLHLSRVPWYIGTTMRTRKYQKQFVVERVQTGVRIEKRLLKVLKALAEFHDLSLGDLLEGIVLHAFDGKAAFQTPSRKRIKELKKLYGLDLDFRASHRLIETRAAAPKTKTSRRTARAKRKPPVKQTRGAQ